MTIANKNQSKVISILDKEWKRLEDLEEVNTIPIPSDLELEEESEGFDDTAIINSEVKNNPENSDTKESPKTEHIAIKMIVKE